MLLTINRILIFQKMSDDEVLRFEITDQDLDNEFNFDMRRPRMSKNQATYGIWAGDSDEDEDPDARPAFAGGGRGGAGRNAPVNFVSAGIQQVCFCFSDGPTLRENWQRAMFFCRRKKALSRTCAL